MRLDRRILVPVLAFSWIFATATRAGEPASDLARAGLVFDGGRFVPGPYALRVEATPEGAEVVLAGVRLDRFEVRPAAIREVALEQPAPFAMPPEAKSLGDSGYSLYLDRLLRHRTEKDGLGRALAFVETEARKSPLVRRVERLEDGLVVFDAEDTPYFVGAGPYLEPPPLTRDETLALARRTADAYRVLLDSGGAILHFEDVDLFLPRARVEDVLLPSLRVLADTKASEEVRRQRLAEYWSNDAVVRGLLDGHPRGAELDLALRPYQAGGTR